MKAFRSVRSLVGNSIFFLSCLSACVLAQAQGKFTDQVKAARPINSDQLASSATNLSNNGATIVTVIAMVLGLVLAGYGLWGVSRASKSEGRIPAAPAWVAIAVGLALGGLLPLFLWGVGALNPVSQ